MSVHSGIADVQSRIAAIQAQFPAPTRPRSDSAVAFADALNKAQAGSATPATGGLQQAYAPASPLQPTGIGGPDAARGAGPAAYAGLFRAAEARHGLPAGLLNAVAKNESGYNARAVSPAGARGLMQFMPATAREMGIDPMVPEQAIDGAARYLASNLRKFKSVDLAVAAYNAGPGAVARYGGIPPYAETRTYVQRVMSTLRGA